MPPKVYLAESKRPPSTKNLPALSLSEENIRIIFGLKMKQVRTEKKLSLAQLSEQCGLSVSYLNEIEKGKKYPKSNKIIKIAAALKLPYDELVSLKLSKKLAPLGELLQSNIFEELPLELFGIDPKKLIEIIANAPAKVNAFIGTLIQIARKYNLSQENFYMSALRSYQESHDNYFEELELAAEAFAAEHGLAFPSERPDSLLEPIIRQKYGYQIDYDDIARRPELAKMRFFDSQQGDVRKLHINGKLDPWQRAFILARVMAVKYLKIKEWASSSPHLKIESFEQCLGNFRAAYFAAALLIPREPLKNDIREFVKLKTWDSQAFLQIVAKYTRSPDMFMQRLSNLLPRYFNLTNLFFMRFQSQEGSGYFKLTKELHFSQFHTPYGNELEEHYCRRWVILDLLRQLERDKTLGPVTRVQRSSFFASPNEYFVIAIAKQADHLPGMNYSVGIGFLLDEELKRKVRFAKADQAPLHIVNQTCERCRIADCAQRVAEPTMVRLQDEVDRLKLALEGLGGSL